MNKTINIVIGVVILAVAAFLYFTRPVAAPTEDIKSSTESAQLESETSAGTLYRISQDDSTAQFSIYEMLRGSPFTAEGTTNQVAGDVSIKNIPGQAPKITLGTVQVDATTFKTDSSQRDGAIARLILKSTEPANQFIKFVPTSIDGLPSSITMGTAFNFTVSGDMTISGVTKPQTLTVSATQTAETFSGLASVTLKRSDYNLNIPNIPFVANVSDTFLVNVAFTAKAVK